MRRQWIPATRCAFFFALLGIAILINKFSAHYFNASIPEFSLEALFAGALIIVLLDFLLSRRLPPVEITRDLPGNLAVDKWTPVKLQIRHHFTHATQVRVFDGVPTTSDYQHLPLTLELKPNQISKSEYQLRPLERGSLLINKSHIEFSSPLGLWNIRYWAGNTSESRVYPDFVAIANYAILATENHTSQIGIRKKQRRGEGMEFHQLREFR
ncbi:MAG TPA: DUF58 domain-containing protein, partial [Cellvibrio sp.]